MQGDMDYGASLVSRWDILSSKLNRFAGLHVDVMGRVSEVREYCIVMRNCFGRRYVCVAGGVGVFDQGDIVLFADRRPACGVYAVFRL